MQRFLREARLAAKLQSEHVVKVHDVGEFEQTGPFIVMGYLGGPISAAPSGQAAFPSTRPWTTSFRPCEALAEAHMRPRHRPPPT